MIIMIFVDDFLVVFPKKETDYISDIRKRLKKQYQIKDYRELTYFIGIRIIWDHPNRKLWLNQAPYIKKVIVRYRISGQYPKISLSSNFSMKIKLSDISRKDLKFIQLY
jgi:Reverse transcriptase (RNA-dependent DNA polymerase)